MHVRTCVAALLAALGAAAGCVVETAPPEGMAAVTGTVTYHGLPVKQGAIHFIPRSSDGLAASGEVADGAVKNVTSRTRGDGVKVGRYRVAITAFNDAYLEESPKRGPNGPDPEAVARTALKTGKPIPVKYNNSVESGLTADVLPGSNVFRFDLED